MAGQDRFQVVRAGFYRGSRAAALVYDVTQLESLEHLPKWRNEILQAVPRQPFILVANKTDLPRAIGVERAEELAAHIDALYVETSALSGEGVSSMFEALARLALAVV
jgi:small GTP-binding protein